MSSTSDRRKTVKVTNSSCEEGGDTEIAKDPDWEDLIASSDSESTDIDECVELNESDEDNDCFSESDFDSDEESHQHSPACQTVSPPTVYERSLLITRTEQFEAPYKPRGYRLCGDNIDKTVRPRYMRSDRGNQSLHYFHFYAVENRVDVSQFSDSPVDQVLSLEVMASRMLPSIADDSELKRNMAVLVSRVLVSHMKIFNFACTDVVNRHIQHQFSKEMSQKSVVVSMQIAQRLAWLLFRLSDSE